MRIRTKFLLLVGGGFVLASAVVVVTAERWMTQRIQGSQQMLFSERLDSIQALLDRKEELLQQTGLPQAYRDGVQSETLRQLAAKYYPSPDVISYPFIVDSAGRVILHPKRPFGDEQLAQKDYIQYIISEGSGTLVYTCEGLTKWCLFRTYEPWQWHIVYTIPQDVLYRDVHQFRWTFLSVMTAVSLAVLGLLAWGVSFLTSPIAHLTSAAAQISDGKLDTPIHASGTDEIAILARGFRRMSEVIREKIRRLDCEIAQRKRAQENLAQLNKTLENRVAERTEELKRSNEQLLAARLAAEAASRAKSDFLANMSHEIRTPMNAIIGFGEMLAEDARLPEDLSRYAGIICMAGRNLLTIINDILDFSKIEAGKLKVEIIDCSVAELLENLDVLLRPSAENKGLKFEILQCDDLPAIIRTDPVRVRQCLINLVNNAIKFTEKGHVYVNVSLISETPSGPFWIRFDVEDTGIGIEPDKLQTIFEPFTQADSSTTRKYGGTGLGLTITKHLAERLGGTISVTSRPGSGSVFTLTIPTHVDVHQQPSVNKYDRAASSKPLPIQNYQFRGEILVAEDAPANQIFIQALLKKMGLSVTIAENGQKAVEAVQQRTFDLVFMDMQMPVMNGYEATEKIKALHPNLPVVALTASAMLGDSEKCFKAGCVEYLVKPIERKKLIEVLQTYLPASEQSPSETACTSAK
jgi:signal transduction histidine kinase/ActR/RegA family two-component response regulator